MVSPVRAVETRRLHEWFIHGLQANPAGVALRIGDRQWTYTELHETALRWATVLADSGARRVGILAVRSIESFAGVIAALYAGAAAVPLSPRFPAARTHRMVELAQVDAVIVDDAGAGLLPQLLSRRPDLTVVKGSAQTLGSSGRLSEPVPSAASDVAYVLFTSGSTGEPKGVPVTHANMDAFLEVNQARYGLGVDDVCSQTFDQTFDLAMFDLFMAWGSGAALVSTPAAAFADLPGFLRRERVSVWFSVPSAIALVRRHGGLTDRSMPFLHWSLFCGEPLLVQDAKDWQRAAPAAVIENLYGPTELTIACSVHRFGADAEAEAVDGVVPIGTLYTGLSHRLVAGADDGEGEGELWVAGPQTFPGYLDAADNTGRLVVADGSTWYRTGDRVRRLAGGHLAYLGRVDRQVKIRGYRVELDEIERAVGLLDGVEQAVAVVVDGPTRRELAVFHLGEPVTPIRSALVRSVPEFMVPRWIWPVEELPRTASGKLDRAALASAAAALAGDGQRAFRKAGRS